MAKETPKKGPTKSALYASLAEATGLARKDVAKVLEALQKEIGTTLGKKKIPEFTVPGLAKIVVIRKPATKAGQRPNPFKPGEMMEVKAKPARNVIKVRPLKALKEMV
ncbi:MAG TPA: HU family DNA-binding protein [Pirellulaceae bacterium]|nr:HU family DNA-binding protein [Pirellulaceae bacterium]